MEYLMTNLFVDLCQESYGDALVWHDLQPRSSPQNSFLHLRARSLMLIQPHCSHGKHQCPSEPLHFLDLSTTSSLSDFLRTPSAKRKMASAFNEGGIWR